jgi:hypothetical protein
MAFDLIQTFTAGASDAYADFTSIPSTYTDLRFICSTRGTASTDIMNMTINGSSAFYMQFHAFGTTVSASFSQSGPPMEGMFQSASASATSQFGAATIYVPNYKNTSIKKMILGTSTGANATASKISGFAGSSNDTTTITSFRFTPASGNFVQGSTIYLYGIN